MTFNLVNEMKQLKIEDSNLMNKSIKDRIIDKLNQFSESFFVSLENDEKLRMIEENNQLIHDINRWSIQTNDRKTGQFHY